MVVFLMNTVGGDISGEKRIQIVIRTICEGEEVYREMPKALRETGIDREV